MLAPERHRASEYELQLQAGSPTPSITSYPQWVCWQYGKVKPNGKREKLPIDPNTGRAASIKKPETWGAYDEAAAAADMYGCEGIGFVFTEHDPFAGIDYDGVINEDAEIEGWASELVVKFGSYTEFSPSNTGLHTIVCGKLSGKGINSGQVEVYDRDRFFTWTGRQYGGWDRVEDRQDELDELYGGLQAAQKAPQKPRQAAADTYTPEDHEVLQKARNANATGPIFMALYDEGAVTKRHKDGRPDHSSTHYELARMLAFWTGNDAVQVERLFTASAHGQHDKWARQDYRDRTIARSIERTPKPYQWVKTRPKAVPEVQAKLDQIGAAAERHVWGGRNGARNRWVLDGLVSTGGEKGQAHPAGVAVTVSVRFLAWSAGIGGTDAVHKALKELEADGWIGVLKRGRKRDESSTYLLRSEGGRKSGTGCLHTPVETSVPEMRGLLRSVRENGSDRPGGEFKASGIDGKRKVSYVVEYPPTPAVISGSVGNAGALLIEKVLLCGGRVHVDELAAIMGSKRASDFKRRQLAKVLGAGLLSMHEGVVSAPADLRERLEKHLQDTGCNRAAETQMGRIKAARIKADSAPTQAELRAGRPRFQQNLVVMRERDRERDYERELEKVGPTPTTFLRDEVSGVYAMYWPAIVERFEKRGGHKRIISKAADRMNLRWIKEWDGWYVALREAVPAA